MKGTVKFSKEFVTTIGLKEWVSIELPIGEKISEEEIKQAFIDAKKAVCDFQLFSGYGLVDVNNPISLNTYTGIKPDPPYNAPPPIITVERTSEDVRIAELIQGIFACTEIEGENGLLTYNKVAASCKEAKQAFDIMFRKLTTISSARTS